MYVMLYINVACECHTRKLSIARLAESTFIHSTLFSTHLPDSCQNPEHNQEDVADTRRQRHEQRGDGTQQHEPAEHVLAAEPGRQVAAGHLRDHVAPEERAENQALHLLVPRKLAVLLLRLNRLGDTQLKMHSAVV